MKYQEECLIEYNDCDENSRLKLTALVDLMMQTSEHQLEKGGAGTKALLARGIGWVVTQYHFEIKRLPHALEKLIFTTEASGYNRFFEYRSFSVQTLDGQNLIQVRSQWVMLDLAKRKLLPANTQMMKSFGVPLLQKMPRFPHLRPLSSYDQQEKVRVGFYDLDTNHHLTNSHYFNWFVNLLDRDFLREHLPQQIDLRFAQEVKYQDQPVVALTQKDQQTNFAIYSDEQLQAVCQINWRQLKHD